MTHEAALQPAVQKTGRRDLCLIVEHRVRCTFDSALAQPLNAPRACAVILFIPGILRVTSLAHEVLFQIYTLPKPDQFVYSVFSSSIIFFFLFSV